MYNFFNNLKPIINREAIFNLKVEVNTGEGISMDIEKDFSIIKIKNMSQFIVFNDEENLSGIIKEIFTNYLDANKILQIGFNNGYLSDQILSSVHKKNKGDIKLTCIDEAVLVENVKKIDMKYPYKFQMVMKSIFYANESIISLPYDLIFICKSFTDNELYNILKKFSKNYSTRIIIFYLENLDIIRFMNENNYMIISEIMYNEEYFIVDFKFSEVKTDPYPYFDIYQTKTINYIME